MILWGSAEPLTATFRMTSCGFHFLSPCYLLLLRFNLFSNFLFLMCYFSAPSGMIESTPYLFGNAWRVSSACVPRPSLPQLDPCDTHQQAGDTFTLLCITQRLFKLQVLRGSVWLERLTVISAAYAVEKCDVLTQEVFSACHEYVSPVGFQLQCRADVCRCGAPCLCSILAHYTRTCRRHGVIIEFRSHLPECGESDTYTCIHYHSNV